MKQCLVFVIAFQLLVTSVLGYAHLASEPHEPYEGPHIHADKSMFGSVDESTDSECHDRAECHSHLFSFVLPPFFEKPVVRNPELSFSIEPQAVGIVHAPPVPPPTV